MSTYLVALSLLLPEVDREALSPARPPAAQVGLWEAQEEDCEPRCWCRRRARI